MKLRNPHDGGFPFPNHPDWIDWILYALGLSPLVFVSVYYLGVALGWWR